MSDSFSEVSSQSWFSRIGESIKGILFGGLMFLASFVVLFWNEGRAVQTYKSLNEAQGATVAASAESVDAAKEGKPVYLTGKAVTEGTLADDEFGVSAPALKLKRDVEMYQWKENEKSEKKKKLGGGEETVTTYTYEKVWDDDAIDSDNFKKSEEHRNPGSIPYESKVQTAEPITLGAYTLSKSLVGMINNYTPLTLDGKAPLPEDIKDKAKVDKNQFYIGNDPAEPKIGDVRVKFSVANPTEVSIIAQQAQKSFQPIATKAGDNVELLEIGTVSQEQMFKRAQDRNTMLTWILRGVGFFLMFSGLGLILKPLSVLADVIPMLGGIVGFGAGVIAFLMAAALSLATIAIAWLFYRPLFGGILLAVAAGVIVLVLMMLKKRKTTAVAPAA